MHRTYIDRTATQTITISISLRNVDTYTVQAQVKRGTRTMIASWDMSKHNVDVHGFKAESYFAKGLTSTCAGIPLLELLNLFDL